MYVQMGVWTDIRDFSPFYMTSFPLGAAVSIPLLSSYPVSLMGGYITHLSPRETPSELQIYQKCHRTYHILLSNHIFLAMNNFREIWVNRAGLNIKSEKSLLVYIAQKSASTGIVNDVSRVTQD